MYFRPIPSIPIYLELPYMTNLPFLSILIHDSRAASCQLALSNMPRRGWQSAMNLNHNPTMSGSAGSAPTGKIGQNSKIKEKYVGIEKLYGKSIKINGIIYKTH